MTEGENKEPIQSTGTKLENIGVIVIDNATKKIERNEIVKVADLKDEDADTKALSDSIIADVDARLGAVFAKSEVDLDGSRDPGVRTRETNLGDLITDALRGTRPRTASLTLRTIISSPSPLAAVSAPPSRPATSP